MNLWSVEYFLAIFVITFGWVQQEAKGNPPKSDDKNGQEMFNWPEVHSEKKYKIGTLVGFWNNSAPLGEIMTREAENTE